MSTPRHRLSRLTVITASVVGVASTAGLVGCAPPGTGCDAQRLPAPQLQVEGVTATPGAALALQGTVTGWAPADEGGPGAALTIEDETHGPVTVRWTLPQLLPVDLAVGRTVKVVYHHTIGFGGEARGLRVEDDTGVVFLVDDGVYGNALSTAELAPFTVGQEDAGCRNRNNQPGSLNSFWLVVTAPQAESAGQVRLLQGQTGELEHDNRAFAVLAIWSVSRVGDVRWTDAPYEHKAFAIARKPSPSGASGAKTPGA